MSSFKTTAAGAALAATAIVTPAAADVNLFVKAKDGQCLRTTLYAKTGMDREVTFGGRAVRVHVPESMRGNPDGAKIVFEKMSQIAVNYVDLGAAIQSAISMQCGGAGAGSWAGFCGNGKVERFGNSGPDLLSDPSCKAVDPSFLSNDGPENLFEELSKKNTAPAQRSNIETAPLPAAPVAEAPVIIQPAPFNREVAPAVGTSVTIPFSGPAMVGAPQSDAMERQERYEARYNEDYKGRRLPRPAERPVVEAAPAAPVAVAPSADTNSGYSTTTLPVKTCRNAHGCYEFSVTIGGPTPR